MYIILGYCHIYFFGEICYDTPPPLSSQLISKLRPACYQHLPKPPSLLLSKKKSWDAGCFFLLGALLKRLWACYQRLLKGPPLPKVLCLGGRLFLLFRSARTSCTTSADALMLLMLLMRWCCWCCWCADAADALKLLMLLMRWCCWCSWYADAADTLMLLMHWWWWCINGDVLMMLMHWCTNATESGSGRTRGPFYSNLL